MKQFNEILGTRISGILNGKHRGVRSRLDSTPRQLSRSQANRNVDNRTSEKESR